MEIETKVSPMMEQWHACKAKAKDALLLFRLGDFYEAFYDDASVLARELDLTLTKRQGIPMSGIPAQTLDNYVDTLVGKGLLVAIAEQMESAKESKTLVRRDIVRIVSPGANLNLSESSHNFFAGLAQVNASIGLAFLDISTGDLVCLEVEKAEELPDALSKRSPKEILVSEKFFRTHTSLLEELKRLFSFRLTVKEDWHFDHQIAYNFLTKHFRVHSLDGLGLKGAVSSINAIGALLYHVGTGLCQTLDAVKTIWIESPRDHMQINHTTAHHLDLAGLYTLLNQTKTAMGARLLKHWIAYPLLNPKEIERRQDGIAAFVRSPLLLEDLLGSIRDLERLAVRIQTKIATPRDVWALADSLEALPPLKSALVSFNAPIIQEILPTFFDFSPIVRKIKDALIETPPTKYTEGGIFKASYHAELAEIRDLKHHSETWLVNYQTRLRESLDIKTLKVGYSKAFGYFIEVSRGQATRMPASFEKRQTLVGAERFLSPELKEYEHKILHAEEKMIGLEKELFLELHSEVAKYCDQVQEVARSVALIDVLHALACVASDHNYVRPEVTESDTIDIVEGRHPILELFVKGEHFIPNDVHLSSARESLLLITGPNMAGKSTFIRQAALLVIMAQMGSFVPAKSAKIGIVDKVFSRIGASDDLSRGQSTFMVEMSETASILHTLTPNSLVILDEIGRGTSTYDGIAIASAVAEHLVKMGVKTLFATHFWELTKLEATYPKAKNYRVAVQENEDGIIFLHKILPGGADKSYGIHVAKLAGLPGEVIQRAQKLLNELEETKVSKKKVKEEQFLLFSEPDDSDVSFKVRGLDLNKTTPLEALQFLLKLQHELS